MTNPSGTGGMIAEGLHAALFEEVDPARGPNLRTHLAAVHEGAEMNIEGPGTQILQKMHALLSNTRTQLATAVEEANQLQAWSSDEVSANKGL